MVCAVYELRWLGATSGTLGATGLAAGLLVGSIGTFTILDTAAAVVLFGLSVGSALAGLFLGRRSLPPIVYAQIFERSPVVPPTIWREPSRRTAVRAALASLGLAAGMAIMAAAALVVTLVFLGKSRDELLTHLPAAAGLVAAGWSLVAGVSALRIAAWIERWEHPRGRLVLCRPLSSGRLLHVYYIADAAEPPPVRSSR